MLVTRSLIITTIFITAALHAAAQEGASSFEFIENKGQWDKQVAFKGQLPNGNFYLNRNGFTVVQHNTDDLLRFYNEHSQRYSKFLPASEKQARTGNTDASDTATIRSHAYQVQFVGGAADAQIVPDKVQPGYVNYLIGNDPSKWASKVKTYQAVLYKNVYPNIDVRYYSENGHLKYDLIVNPGGNVNDIAMRYTGANKLSIKNQELVIKTSVSDVKELYPYTFQFDNVQGRQEVTCSYVLEDRNTVRFKVSNYAKGKTLVIDPTLIFSSFTGSTADEWGYTATPGPDGSFYSGGIVFSSGFPVSPGAYKTSYTRGGAKGVDIGILKFTPDGTQRAYATYLGGSRDEFPHSLYCDAQGNLVILGRTYSTDYPGSVEGKGGACDMVVTKLNAGGTGIIGSMRIGGTGNDGLNIEDQMETNGHKTNSLLTNYGDDSHSEVILDDQGYIYVAGQTQSTSGAAADMFPMRGSGFQQTPGGAQDGVLLKINPDCNTIIWSSFLGGTGNDAAFVLALRPNTKDIYVAGGTASTDFPKITAGTIKTTLASNDIDGYVAIVSNDGTTQQRATYVGTNSIDLIFGIQFDRDFYPYILGTTRGTWPIKNAAYSVSGAKQFICKLQPDLTDMVYSTSFGTNNPKPNISPVAFLVDRCENVYVSGWGGWYAPATDPYNLAGTVGMDVTPDALKSVSDGRDFYFIVIKRDASALLYGSFFGQDGGLGEHVDGGTSRFDAQGVIYQAICANCGGNNGGQLPITKPYMVSPTAYATKNGALPTGCNLGALKIAFNFAGVGSGPKAYFNGVVDTVGCVPFTVVFKDTILNAKSYEWDFGDHTDTTTTTFDVTHTFTSIGKYRVRLIAIDSSSCNIRDTAYVTITVRDDPADLAFTYAKLPPCESLTYQFDNTTTFPPNKPFKASSFTWDFGDGTRVTPAPKSIQHSYASAGSYKITLVLTDTAYCNAPDSVSQSIWVSPLVDARFETPTTGCVPYTAVFNNTSIAGQQFYWDFGDGTTSTDVNPIHQYNSVGTYHITLIAVDSNTCNISDTTSMDLNTYPKPTADFTVSPVPPQANQPTIFTNASTGGVRYLWEFGDDETVAKTTMDTVMHQYNATGTFNACLITYNQYGCTDTVCKTVEALVNPLLDVPNAFTPGRFGVNSYVMVTGFGIGKMTWKIYNRWGQLVFQTADRKVGWDGTYKGQPQPMDVYAYTLDVEFTDGRKLRKTGDITLIR